MSLPATIKYQNTFLNSPSASFDGVFDWSFTAGCFGKGKITPMDFDGVIERKGNFLVFETKGVGVPVPSGQMITYQSFYKHSCVTVVFIEGKLNPQLAKVWCQPGFKNGVIMKNHAPTTPNRMAGFCNEWYEFSNKNPVDYCIGDIRKKFAESRSEKALLLREYLIEVSGNLLNNGLSKTESDQLASEKAHAKFGVDVPLCMGILKGVK